MAFVQTTLPPALPEEGTPEHAEMVARQNDAFRRYACGGAALPEDLVGKLRGRLLYTAGVAARDVEFKMAALAAVAGFELFEADNDPDGYHDFGAFQIADEKLFWKIDAYDAQFEYGSDNPADLTQTARVLTIMLANEW